MPATPVSSRADTTVVGDDGLERITPVAGGRRGARRTSARTVERLGGIVLLFVIWELASRTGWLDERTLGAPSTVAATGWDMVRDHSLPRALWASSQRVLWAMAIGVPLGATLAAIAGLSRPGDALVDANIQMLRYVPLLVLQPLLIVWLGVGESTKVALITVGVTFPVYVNTVAAIRSIDPGHHELADVLGLTTWQRWRRLVAPGAAAGFLVGLRYAAAVAWLLLIVAEQTNAHAGLGVLMARAQAFVRTDVMVVMIVVYAALGVSCDVLVRMLERVVLRWQPRR